MFNLIGSLFNFGGRTEEQQIAQTSQTNSSVSNSGDESKRVLVETSTQTSNTNATRKDKTLNNEQSTNDQEMTKEHQDDANSVINKSMSGEDWVIVDKMDDAEPSNLNRPLINHVGINTSMHRSVVHQTESNDSVDTLNTGHTDQPSVSSHPNKVDEELESDDVLLGSFFERNEREEMNTDEQMVIEQQQPSKKSREDWLITPLPCLTSMTPSKQRSIIESDPLENLLIEHPSMSVFVAATSSESCSDHSSNDLEELSQITQSNWQKVESKKRKKKNKKQVFESSSSSMVVIATTAVAVEPTVIEIVQQQQQQQQTVLADKNTPVVAEKRKESERTVEAPVTQSPTLSLALIRKRGKKSKKASSPSISSSASVNSLTSASNKENLQVLLFSPYKKGVSGQNNKETGNLNKKQMKRNNKLATTRHANSKQRKYHNLQQPAAFYNSAQKIF